MNRDELNQLKQQAGLKPYQARLKDLKPNGSEYRASCPWHESSGDHNPSLSVFKGNDGEWCFKCMSKCSDKKGDVISFVRFTDKLTFAEACRKISNDVGIAEPVAPTTLGQPTAEQCETVRQYLADHGVSFEIAKARKMDAVIHPKLGLAVAMPYDSDSQVIKYRVVGKPKDKNSKFSHASGHPSEDLLYNIKQTEKELSKSFCSEVYVVESERDCLMMNSLGFMAVSVSSATTCVDQGGKLKIDESQLEILARADEIFLALDQDPAGQKCADAFETDPAFNGVQVKRIEWKYGGKRSKDPKDIGDLYKQDPAGFCNKVETLAQEARCRPPKWRQAFKTPAEMDTRPIIQLIEGFMTEGNIGIGGLSGSGKTFVAMSITKALTTGQPFVGHFKVPEKVPVLYLIPEVGERQFYKRVEAFGIPLNDDSIFMARTLSQGETLPLDNPWVLDAIRNFHNPVVVLDTAIRFSKSKDENSARDNLWMEQAMRGLREAGAIAVIALHHSLKKNAKDKDFSPTLENTFRGTGDIGALLDIGYSVRRDKKVKDCDGQHIIVQCVKPRDFDPPNPFTLGLRYLPANSTTGKLHSYINETGDLKLISSITSDNDNCGESYNDIYGDKESQMMAARNSDKGKIFVQQVTANPQISKNTLREVLKVRKDNIGDFASSLGFTQTDGMWVDTLLESVETV